MISGAILSGGRGERLGREKGLTTLGAKPFIVHIAEAMEAVAEDIVLSVSKGRRDDYAGFARDFTIVEDSVAGLGPLGGIISVLENVESELVLFSPCDTPFLNSGVCGLIASCAEGVDGAVPMTGRSYYEPLHGVYRRGPALAAFKEIGEKGCLSPQQAFGLMRMRFISEARLREVDPELESFRNINSREQLELAKKRFDSKTQALSIRR